MAEPVSELLVADLLSRLSQFGVRTRGAVDGTLTGLHRSPQHGSSVEFAEHKEYSPGDEIKHIDWKVYGRTDKHYVKRFEDETNLRAYFVVDASGSMAYGRGEENKLRYAQRLVANLGYLLFLQQDAAGLVAVGEDVQAYLPPRARSAHLREMCVALAELEAQGTTGLAAGLDQVTEVAGKRALVYLVSDLFLEEDVVFRRLRQLRSQNHHVVVFHVLHHDELVFPFRRLTTFEALEGPQRMVVEARAVRAVYRSAMRAFLGRLEREAGNARRSFTVRSEYSRPKTQLPMRLKSMRPPIAVAWARSSR